MLQKTLTIAENTKIHNKIEIVEIISNFIIFLRFLRKKQHLVRKKREEILLNNASEKTTLSNLNDFRDLSKASVKTDNDNLK